MIKVVTLISFSAVFIYSSLRAYSEKNIYTPQYQTISKNKSIYIRDYDQFSIITTTKNSPYKRATYSGFRTLANYIFGNNIDNIKIPMTSPVITTLPDTKDVEISFIIDKSFGINNMPKPNTNDIDFKSIKLGRVAVIQFGFWATPKRISNMKNKLISFLNDNSIDYSSDFLVAQYNSPWILPPFRKNEIIVSINQ